MTNIRRDSAWYTIVTWMFKPGVVAGYIIALWYVETFIYQGQDKKTCYVFIFSVAVYYMRAVAHARGAMVELLRNMLVLEAEDKIFLQKNIREAKTGRKYLSCTFGRSSRF